MKTANLKVIFQTKEPNEFLYLLKGNLTPVIQTYTDKTEYSPFAYITALFHTTNIEKTLNELANYPDAFIKRAFYNDDTSSQEDTETANSWIATTIINQFDNRYDNITYYNRNTYDVQPISSVSSYLESQDFKNGIFATQYEDKLICDLYGQTGEEKTYLFEGHRKN